MRGGGGGDLARKYIQASHGAQFIYACCVVVMVDPWGVWNCNEGILWVVRYLGWATAVVCGAGRR